MPSTHLRSMTGTLTSTLEFLKWVVIPFLSVKVRMFVQRLPKMIYCPFTLLPLAFQHVSVVPHSNPLLLLHSPIPFPLKFPVFTTPTLPPTTFKISVNSSEIHPPSVQPVSRDDIISAACVNALSQSVNVLQTEFDALDVQGLFMNSSPEFGFPGEECSDLCKSVWKDWESSMDIKSLLR